MPFINNLRNSLQRGFDRTLQTINEEDVLRQQIQDRYNELTNPLSPLYQTINSTIKSEIFDNLNKSTASTQNLLAVGLAKGLGYKTASTIAKNQREDIEKQNRAVASRQARQGTTQAYASFQGLGNAALGMDVQNKQFGRSLALSYAQLAEQQRQFDESQPTFGDNLLNTGLNIGSFGLGKYLFGGGTASSTPSNPPDLQTAPTFNFPKLNLNVPTVNIPTYQ